MTELRRSTRLLLALATFLLFAIAPGLAGTVVSSAATAVRCDGQDFVTQSKAASQLLSAGYEAYEKGDYTQAEALWIEVSLCSPKVPSWPKAMYNLGLTKQRNGDFRSAIGYFRQVIDSHPNDKEPGGDIMEVYRNYSNYSAMRISECYEKMGDYNQALHWARLAKNRYRYQSWCGTCLQSVAIRTNERIAYLSARLAAPYSFALLLVGGVVIVRKRKAQPPKIV